MAASSPAAMHMTSMMRLMSGAPSCLRDVAEADDGVRRRIADDLDLLEDVHQVAGLLLVHVDREDDRINEDPVELQPVFQRLAADLADGLDAAVHVLQRPLSVIVSTTSEAPCLTASGMNWSRYTSSHLQELIIAGRLTTERPASRTGIFWRPAPAAYRSLLHANGPSTSSPPAARRA